MAVATEVVARRYINITANTPISVDYPLYEAEDVVVFYGIAPLTATLNVDYTVVLDPPNFDTFILTPTNNLLNKINALTAGDPSETNYITVRRDMDYLTDSTAAAVRYTPFTSREFDRTVLRFQQIAERLNRTISLTPNFVGDTPSMELAGVKENSLIGFDNNGVLVSSETPINEKTLREQDVQALASLIGKTGVITELTFESAKALEFANVSSNVSGVQTLGFYEPRDGGGASYYRKGIAEASAPGDRTSNSGTVRWGLSERFPNVLQFGVRTDVATEGNTALVQEAYNYSKGRTLFVPEGRYYITETIIKPDGVMDYGAGKYDYWANNRDVGTIFVTSGPGNPKRWTDIDGADPSDDTPMFVMGGNGVHSHGITLITEGATPWSAGWFAPCVKQCGLHDCQAFGFTDGCVYLDATWSDRNTTLKNLHPAVNPSTGMNEFTVEGCWFIASSLGGFAVKIQGTTRSGTSVATASEWLWGYGGTSDIRLSNCRWSGRHASGGEFSHDAQLFGANAYGQGVSIHDCGFRGSGSGFAVKLDRSNRIIFTACYGEEVGTGVHAFSVTSRTKLGVDGITLRQDKLNVPMYVDGVQVASTLSQCYWELTECVTIERANGGRLFTPNIEAYGPASGRGLRLTSTHSNGLVIFSSRPGGVTTEFMYANPTVLRPFNANGMALGTGTFPWSAVNAGEINVGSIISPTSAGTVNIGSNGSGFALGFFEGFRLGTSAGRMGIYTGSGSPEGVQAAALASQYYDLTNGRSYEKRTGTGNTGWVIHT